MRIYYTLIIVVGLALAHPKVVAIKFVGNNSISSWELLNAMESPKPVWYQAIFGIYPSISQQSLDKDTSTIALLYKDKGFLDVKLAVKREFIDDSSKVRLFIFIEEGKKWHIGNIKLSLPPEFDVDIAKKSIKISSGQVFSPFSVAYACEELRRYIANQGYPYAFVQPNTSYRDDTALVDIELVATPGRKAFFGDVTYRGLRYSKNFVARRAISAKKGDLFSLRALEKSTEELYSMRLFRMASVELRDTAGQPETVRVEVTVVEHTPAWYGASISVGANKDYDFTAEAGVEWGHRNFLGNGQQIKINGDVQAQMVTNWQLVSQKYELSFTEPWAFVRPFPVRLSLYFQPGMKTEQYAWRVQKIGAQIVGVLTKGNIQHTFTATFEKSDVYGVPSDQPDDVKKQQGIFIEPKLSYSYTRDLRDNPFSPGEGSLTRFNAEISSGLLASSANYGKIDFQWSRYICFWHKFVSATRVHILVIGNYKSGEDVPPYVKAMSGGANSVRGFPELSIGPTTADGKPLGGKVLLVMNQSIRFPIIWRFYGHTFIDCGNVWDEWKSVDPHLLHVSTGAGLAFMTPVGPIRLDWAKIIANRGNFPPSRWHLSFLYPF